MAFEVVLTTMIIFFFILAVVPMIASINGHEGDYATGIAVVSFIACVVTIPLVAYVVL